MAAVDWRCGLVDRRRGSCVGGGLGRLGSAWAGNVEADGGVGLGWLGPTTEAGGDVEHGVTERESD